MAAGCKAVCLTLSNTGADWNSIDTLRKGLKVPFLLKGVMTPGDSTDAARHGIQGIVVSNYVGGPATAANAVAQPMEVLPGIADAVGGKIPILVDGSFRRGSDILMALALGANGVLIGRPVAWGLAAYGPDGVRHVIELLQTELGRDMAMCGKVNLQSIDRATIKVHKW
jgi:isopentenyl diphosphate isomerase/L-lactate dehydrogenase-like FMN-dependent dehydrogenase